MTPRTRVLVLLAAALAAVVVSLLSLLRMLIPGFLADLPAGLLGRLGPGVELSLALTGGLAALAVSLLALAGRRAGHPPAAGMRIAGLLAAALLTFTTPGGVVPTAGYTFALTVLAGIVVLIVLIVLRRPWTGVLLAAVVVALVVYAVTSFEADQLLPHVFGALVTTAPLMALAVAHVVAAGGLVVWMIADERSAQGRVARFVQRRRVAITVVAAACSLPYAFARATWLTPWPILGGGADMFDADPSVRVMGLILGLGMLTGGFLTLGLVRPWGERFPRFLAGIGGRPVPVALAVIPAVAVAVLFTAAGIEFALEGVGQAGSSLTLFMMFPFWLWGPLLGLAAWGYALHRRERAGAAVVGERAVAAA